MTDKAGGEKGVVTITNAQITALLELVRTMEPWPLYPWIEHLYRCKRGMGQAASSVILFTDLGVPPDHAALMVDHAMSERLDRSAARPMA